MGIDCRLSARNKQVGESSGLFLLGKPRHAQRREADAPARNCSTDLGDAELDFVGMHVDEDDDYYAQLSCVAEHISDLEQVVVDIDAVGDNEVALANCLEFRLWRKRIFRFFGELDVFWRGNHHIGLSRGGRHGGQQGGVRHSRQRNYLW